MSVDKNLLLVSLRDPFLDDDRVMPPIGVMSLMSLVISKGIKATLENDFDLENIQKYKGFSHIGISCMTPQKKQAYEILDKVKLTFPEIKVILGGPHVGHYLKDCMDKSFDYLVKGDGEKALLEILNDTENKVNRVLNMPITVDEMNSFPLPYRHPEFLNKYCFNIQGIKSTTILTSKGCPMKCNFCEDAGTNVKYYTPEYIGEQIVDSKNAGFDGVMFFDDLFAINSKRVKQLTEEIKKHDILYRCFGHAKTMNEDMITMLADSGCIEIGFGSESGSQKILDIVNKKTTILQNYDFVKLCNKYGVKVKAFLMVGLPGEDHDTIKETEDFLSFLVSESFQNKSGSMITNDFDITIYYPYKGTKIRDSIDKGESTFDLKIDSVGLESSSGFYKGIGGTSENIISTKALNEQDIQFYKDYLYEKYKKKVINTNLR